MEGFWIADKMISDDGKDEMEGLLKEAGLTCRWTKSRSGWTLWVRDHEEAIFEEIYPKLLGRIS